MKRKRFPKNASIAFLVRGILAVACAILMGVIIPLSPIAAREMTDPQKIPLFHKSKLSAAIVQMEKDWGEEYEEYFGNQFTNLAVQTEEMARSLTQLGEETGTHPAIIWLLSKSDRLSIALTTPGKPPVSYEVMAADRESLQQTIREFRRAIINPRRVRQQNYQSLGKQLYDWIIAPIETTLIEENIDTLIISAGTGLRAFPYAALYDGERFLIEKYSLTNTPAFYLTARDYKPLKNSRILAMGASEFRDLTPLPGVAVELETIANRIWPGEAFLNDTFTLANLQDRRDRYPFEIVHLATHAQFQSGNSADSFIQLFDERLTLDRLDRLNLDDPPVELLVLSACETALGDRDAELGFAGLAVQLGVKSVLASFWQVSDVGSVALMSEFYQQLKETSTKAEALRQAQIAMIRGEVRWEDGALLNSSTRVAFPSNIAIAGTTDFSHPYHWAAYSLVGSPW
ncbi:MAG: CHAT domain-containing protein [Cyanobacteria bacterium SBLK]|nr:CHAT domain-containing protein [Cyanobacteria bacterium SBLK]